MLREKLYAAIGRAVRERGYTFYSGFEHSMNGTLSKFPAAWLSPLEVTEVEGREEGYVTYLATVSLMNLISKASAAQKEIYWDRMEEEAGAIAHMTGNDPAVCDVMNIKMSPAEYSLSKHGEISMRLSFEARMHFLRP